VKSKLTMLIAIAAVCVTTLWAGWGPEEQITTGGRNVRSVTSCVVAVGNNGYKHVVYRRPKTASVDIWYERWYPSTGWTSEYNIKSPTGANYGPLTITLDGNGTDIHVAWDCWLSGKESVIPRTYYTKCVPAKKGTGTWSTPICLIPDRRTATHDVACYQNRVAVAFSLNYWINPGAETEPVIGYKECIAGVWQPPEYIDVGFHASGVSVAADPQDGDMYVLYQSDPYGVEMNAYVMRRVNGAFQAAELAVGEGDIYMQEASVEVDPSTGFPHVVCTRGDDTESHIWHTYRDASGVWQPLTLVSDEASPNSKSPRMCFSYGSAWVVWDEYDGSEYGIAYAVGSYDNWTLGWVTSGHDDGSPDIVPTPGDVPYAVWIDGRTSPAHVWGSTYTPGDGGQAQPGALSQSSIEMFPNPAKAGRVTVRYSLPREEPLRVTLLDVSGRAVRTQEVAATDKGRSFSIDVSGLNAGVYVARLVAGDLNVSKSLVVER